MGGAPSTIPQAWIDSCNRYAANLPTSEPSVQTWVNQGCTGAQRNIKPGSYADLDRLDGNVYPRRNWIWSMIVPPNMSVQGWGYPNYERNLKATWGPGVYPDLNNPNKGVGGRDIDSMKITRRKPWGTFLRDCCLGTEPAYKCRQFSGPTAGACRNIMNSYCSSSLGAFKGQHCRRWCTNNKNSCDGIAAKLCRGSRDPYCACFNAPSNNIRPACFDPVCSAGTAYQTQNHKNQSGNCGTYCNMQFNIDKVGRDALLNNNTFMQKCGAQANAIIDKERIATDAKKMSLVASKAAANKAAKDDAAKNVADGTASFGGTIALAGGGGLIGLSSSFCCILFIAIAVWYYYKQ